MTFDKPEHKEAFIALLNQATFPGHLLELAVELKQAAINGAVTQEAVVELATPVAATSPRARKRLS